MRTFGNLTLHSDRWVLSGLEPHAVIRLKQLFPRIPKASAGPYVFPADPAHAIDLDWFMGRYPLAIDAGDLGALKQGRGLFEARSILAERLLSPDYTPPAFPRLKAGKSPRQHQAAAAQLLEVVGGLLVGDDVGEGKTFTTMLCCLIPGALPATIVMDPHLQGQWAERFEDFTHLTVHQVTGTKPYALPPADVRLFRWTQLLGWADMLDRIGTGLAAFDEAQELRTGRASGRGEAAYRLVAASRYRLALTATPVYGYGTEIWNVMQFIRPEVLGSYGDFGREWAPNGHVTNPAALGTFLREQHAFVRKRKEGDRVDRVIQPVEHDAAALASIEDVAQALARTAATGSFIERGDASRQLDLRVRMQTGIAKAPYVAKLVRMLVEGGEPVLLAGWHRDVYDIWLEELKDLKPAMYTGSETAAAKKREKARFLAGETDVFILSLRSGRGVDGLQARAKFVVIGELDWSKQVHDQIIGRVDREGSVIDGTDERITAIFCVADDGSDPPMVDIIGLKASESGPIVDPDLGLKTAPSEGRGLKALVERYLARGVNPVRDGVDA